MKQAPVKVRRKFDEMFKREAVQNWLSSGKSAEVIAGERDSCSSYGILWAVGRIF